MKTATIEKGAMFQTGQGFHQSIRFPWQQKARTAYGKTEQEVTDKIAGYMTREQERRTALLAAQAQRRQHAKHAQQEAIGNLKLGDIFVNSWGYEQTNVNFAQVTAIHGLTAELRPIAQEHHTAEGCSPMAEYVTAKKDHFTGEAFTKKIQGWSGQPCFNANYGSYTKWDGRKQYQSHYA